MILEIILTLMLKTVVFANDINEVDDIDSVINLLLSGDYLDTVPAIEEQEDEQPSLSDGIWKCGNCDIIDNSTLIYSEVNEVETNDIGVQPIVVQVALSINGMRCVTVSAEAGSTVSKESGKCTSNDVTLGVKNAQHFVVNVYG